MIISGHKAGDTWLGLSAQIFLNGSPFNISGALIRMQIRKEKSWPSYAYEWSSTGNSILIIDQGTGGSFYICSGIVDVPARNYYYDIELQMPDGQVITPVEGTWDIQETVTR